MPIKRQAVRCHHTHRTQTIHVGPQFRSLRVLIPPEILNMHHSYSEGVYISADPDLPLVLEGIMIFSSTSLFCSMSNLVPQTLFKITSWVLETPFKCNPKEHMKLMGTLHTSQYDLWSTNANNIVAIVVQETTNNLAWNKPQPGHSHVKPH